VFRLYRRCAAICLTGVSSGLENGWTFQKMVWWAALVVEVKLNNDEWISKSMDFKYS